MATNSDLLVDGAGTRRCWWCGRDPQYVDYHDREWGRPVHDDNRLFEKICLEGFQAGLSWLTILRKRENFREAFCHFDFERVAKMDKRDVDRLVANVGIVRHRGKIESTINNAKKAIEATNEFGSLDRYFWQFKPVRPRPLKTRDDVVAKSEESKALSKDLKKRGWSFVGPTTCYAFMQAMGMVNDHLVDCDFYHECGPDV
ncbi:MAG: DNA-3-methyladenine glycosylase I [Aureliella sp.]